MRVYERERERERERGREREREGERGEGGRGREREGEGWRWRERERGDLPAFFPNQSSTFVSCICMKDLNSGCFLRWHFKWPERIPEAMVYVGSYLPHNSGPSTGSGNQL